MEGFPGPYRSGVTPGSYTSADITVDAAGRVIGAANGAKASERPITVTKSGTDYYVRSYWSPTRDIVTRWMIDPTRNGCVQPTDTALVPTATASSGLAAAVVSTSNVISQGTDNIAPLRVNNHTVGSNHGHDVRSITATTHGKAVADIGSVWVDGAAKNWVLLQITDANTLVIVQDYTRDVNGAYTVGSTLTGNLTHVSGATNTGGITVSANAAAFLSPTFRAHTIAIMADGVDLTAQSDGDFQCKNLHMAETYIITDLAAVIDFAKAAVGGGVAPDYADASISGIVEVQQVFRVKAAGETVLHTRITLLGPARLGASYILQNQVIYKPTGYTLRQVIPDTLAIGGLDFAKGVDISSTAPSGIATPAVWKSSVHPPSRMLQTVENASGVPQWGLLLAIDETYGDGRPSLRDANLGASHACELRITTKKQYLIGFGDEITNVASPSGTRFEFVAYRRFFLPSPYGFGYE